MKLVASSLALNDALDVGEGKESTPATLSAMTEFAWKEGGETRLSDTLQTTIINDIIRLATDAPESVTGEYPAPDLVATKSWVNSKQATADTAGFVMLGTSALATMYQSPPGTATDNANIYGFGMVMKYRGQVRSLSTQCRTGGNAAPANTDILA